MALLKNLAISVAAIFLPIKPILIVVMSLCMADMALGIGVALKNKEKITSRGFRRTIAKIIAYEIAVTLGFLVEKYLLEEAIPIVKILSSLIGLTEMKSILENVNIISGEDIFKSLIEKLSSESNK